MNKKIAIASVLIIILIMGYFVYFRFIFDGSYPLIPVVREDLPEQETVIEEDQLISIDQFPDWLSYINTEYGFMVRYPSNYNEVRDIYGWPNSVVHFIENTPSGAQAYRARIEIWDDELGFVNSGQYVSGRQPDFMTDLGDKYLTISYEYTKGIEDVSIKEDWERVISSFELIN